MRGRTRPRAGGENSRVGSVLLVVGCLVILGGTFGLGLLAGRHWHRVPLVGGAAPTNAPATTATPAREAERGSRPRTGEARGEAGPTLTFYHELTAPLTAPPPVPPPARKPKPERPEAVPKPAAAAVEKPELPRPDGTATSAGRFTVQVGAYKTRSGAEAFRATLVGRGHDAYVAEVDGPGPARFRVRVGTFVTREAAAQTAARLRGEQIPSTYVTAR